MSRVGRRIILVPEQVNITFNPPKTKITLKGPLGTLTKNISNLMNVIYHENTLKVVPKTLSQKAIWGTTNSLLNNYVLGVTKGFNKNLLLKGLGYKAIVKDDHLELALGFSHLINFAIPKELKITVKRNTEINIFGIDKEQVGLIASQIRKLKKPEPYKGKGVRYADEQITLKVGKTGASKK